jgi:hypothetical protein
MNEEEFKDRLKVFMDAFGTFTDKYEKGYIVAFSFLKVLTKKRRG